MLLLNILSTPSGMLPFADPVAMSLKRAERVQAFEPDGTEKCAPDARWAFMALANVTDKESDDEATNEAEQEEKPTLPWRALEAIQTAKACMLRQLLRRTACI